jgi:UDP-N-acetylglucosamine diphosphorylase / glucose-1-phosphate thymidylyltransferase / UDP-N-acetylgalactosamine diphosphorylase / glucosamine-1-phosphate N-acetyltransferase / galactosamine-1-phosphate N-acetyltransferase
MVNILIPMAGLGSRFSQAGYSKPKPFIDVLGKPMIIRVLENLKVSDCRFILIMQKNFISIYQDEIRFLVDEYNVEIIEIDLHTEGAACTTLFALDQINNSTPLIVANSDQLIDINLEEFIHDAQERHLDGSILVFESNHPKWSYVKTDADGIMISLKEKEVISNNATVGIYYFSKGHNYVNSAIRLIINNDRVKNEFYVAPVYNYMLHDYQQRIGIYKIKQNQMHGLGTPEDLEEYLMNEKR